MFGFNLDDIKFNKIGIDSTDNTEYDYNKLRQLKKIQSDKKIIKEKNIILHSELRSTPPIPNLFVGGEDYFNLKEEFSSKYGSILPRLALPIHATPKDLIYLDRLARIKPIYYSPKADGIRKIKKSKTGVRVLTEVIGNKTLVFGLVRQDLDWDQQINEIKELPEIKSGLWQVKLINKMYDFSSGKLLKKISLPPKVELTDGFNNWEQEIQLQKYFILQRKTPTSKNN